MKKKKPNNNSTLSIIQRLILFAEDHIIKIVKSQIDQDQIFCLVKINGHIESIEIGSKRAEQWLQHIHYEETKEVHPESYSKALSTIKSKCVFSDISQEKIHNRIATVDNVIYYDLGTTDWKLIKISENVVEMVEMGIDTPIFERKQHQKTQVMPKLEEKRDTLEELSELLRIQPHEKQIFQSHLVAMFVPHIATPIMIASGEQGSIKSTFTRTIKRIVDPSGENDSSIPKDEESLILLLYNRYLTNFDNVSSISKSKSDTFCKAVTGGGLSKRKLYHDLTEVILSFKHKIVLNGIGISPERGDLMERSISYDRQIPLMSERITEDEFEKQFQELLPSLLEKIFLTISDALSLYPKIENEIKEKPRMADFTVFGECISRALGYEKFSFVNAYNEKIKHSSIEVVDNHPLADIISKLLDNSSHYEDTVGNFYSKCIEIAKNEKINLNNKNFPSAPNKIKQTLQRIGPPLLNLGYRIKLEQYTKNDQIHPKARTIIYIDKKSE